MLSTPRPVEDLMTDEDADRLIAEYYGIDAAARRVDNVGIYASGKMAHWSERRGYVFHVINEAGAREEIARLFNWVEVTELSPATPNHLRRQILSDLQAKARGERPPGQDSHLPADACLGPVADGIR